MATALPEQFFNKRSIFTLSSGATHERETTADIAPEKRSFIFLRKITETVISGIQPCR
jgi:hypothetical protein